ncbi:MAG: hypothetical protein [Wendovervirus sonii]|uniref:Uncharacterized protein n=1 Tax=phage Lak_Megaphage_Sonny TaxID=3109229 RepID=A0ABZ0Z3B6_9CAUD|nr:MAG: hypothetical protein [phage Lak_Megaphage_Sonny]
MNKKQLYESIMKMVSHEVKKALNENVNESLADFRQKYSKKENEEKIAKAFDEVMEICKPFFADGTFTQLYGIRDNARSKIEYIKINSEINGKDFCEKYLNNNFKKYIFITVDDRAYIEYAKETSTKDNMKYINYKTNGSMLDDNTWCFFFNQNQNNNILAINLEYLSNADQNIKDLFYKWLGGNVD